MLDAGDHAITHDVDEILCPRIAWYHASSFSQAQGYQAEHEKANAASILVRIAFRHLHMYAAAASHCRRSGYEGFDLLGKLAAALLTSDPIVHFDVELRGIPQRLTVVIGSHRYQHTIFHERPDVPIDRQPYLFFVSKVIPPYCPALLPHPIAPIAQSPMPHPKS